MPEARISEVLTGLIATEGELAREDAAGEALYPRQRIEAGRRIDIDRGAALRLADAESASWRRRPSISRSSTWFLSRTRK